MGSEESSNAGKAFIFNEKKLHVIKKVNIQMEDFIKMFKLKKQTGQKLSTSDGEFGIPCMHY